MDKALKKRLVGAIVLVALGVIFIPALLDGSGYKSRHARSVDIPAEPDFPSLSEKKIKPIATPIDQKKKAKKKQSSSEPIRAWALQVGTFGDHSNALALRDKLRKQGHTAYVESVKSGDKQSYRVRIGPELDMARIEKLRDKLKQEQGIDGFVVNHP